jgi:hypothetical protein
MVRLGVKAIYEKHFGGWMNVFGASAASPLIAAVYALAGNAAVIRPGHECRHRGSLFDITKGYGAHRPRHARRDRAF